MKDYDRKKKAGQTEIKGQVAISDAEKITTAFKLALKRAYNFGAISFENNAKCTLIVNDEDMFNTIVSDIGFKNGVKFKAIVSRIAYDSYIYAVNLD